MSTDFSSPKLDFTHLNTRFPLLLHCNNCPSYFSVSAKATGPRQLRKERDYKEPTVQGVRDHHGEEGLQVGKHTLSVSRKLRFHP